MKRSTLAVLATLLVAVGGFGLLDRVRPSSYGVQAQSATQETSEADASQAAARLDEARALLEDEQNTTDIIATYGPSVVAVNVEVRGQRVDPFSQNLPQEFFPPEFRRFFQLPEPQQPQDTPEQPQDDLGEFRQQGSGSGFVVSENGDIITNYHVARAALQEDSVEPLENTRLTVTFPSSDEELPVRVVGVNALYDLALLQLENPEDLPETVRPIPLGDSDALRVGQKTIAIGNPFGFASTVTTGIVSGVSRSLPGVGEANIPLVQTDAAINPGNSGGPLLNSKGELIGINTAIIPGLLANGERGNLGIGFAVPSNLLQQNLAELQQGGFADISSRPRIGVSIADVRAFPESVRESFNLPENGVVVRTVEPGSPAEKAGLRGGSSTINIGGTSVEVGGDVITAVDGQEVQTPGELQNIVLSKNEGDTVELRVLRDGEEQSVTVTLGVVPRDQQTADTNENEPQGQSETPPSGPRLGVAVQDVGAYPDDVRQSLNLPEGGVVVTEVAPDSPAAAAGLRGGQFALDYEGQQYAAGGDVILAVDGEEVESAEALQQLISSHQAGDTLELRIWRNGEEQTLNATLAEATPNN